MLRFRFILISAFLITLMLASAGVFFHNFLASHLYWSIRNSLDQDWATLKGFLQIKDGRLEWLYDRDDHQDTYTVARIQRVFLLTDAQGSMLQVSDLYSSLQGVTPGEVKAAVLDGGPAWKIKWNGKGTAYLIRSGVVYSRDEHHDPYFVEIGRSLANNERAIRQVMLISVGLMLLIFFSGCVFGWAAGRRGD